MRNLISAAKSRLIPLLVASVLLSGGIGASVLLTGGHGTSVMLTAETADADACAVGADCTITGSLGMTAGALTLTSPTSLTWAETVTGLDQKLVDTTTADQTYQVNDSRGTAPGWHVTVSATTFTSVSPAATLANTLTFSTNGSITSMAATTAPTAACLTGSTCTVPTSPVVPVAYPVTITAGAAASAAPVNIYDTALGTGTGTINVGLPGGAPVGWWLNVPSNTIVDTYISTVSLELITGP
jgi:hypothetical protein